MKKAPASTKAIEKYVTSITGMRIGRIVQMNDSGQFLVDFPGNQSGALVARVTSAAHVAFSRKGNPIGREVLLAFENNDPQNPIIVDAMYSLLEEISEQSTVVLEAEAPQDAIIDGKRILFDAGEEIILQCGKARITLTRAGKILIQGEYVLSSSKGANKIKGGSIQLN
jgi:hypothetical protein